MQHDPPARQRLTANAALPRHRHDGAYVALVLAGGYAEAGETGRRRLRPGDVVVHPVFDAHLNSVASSGATVLNLRVDGLPAGFGRVPDPDAVARLAERDPLAARTLLRTVLSPVPPDVADWPDLLAAALVGDPRTGLRDWAAGHGLAPETVSRGFRRAFGVTPKRFRYEAQTRRALEGLTRGAAPLAEVALAAGFADQAHMGRAVASLTGAAPGHWRRSSQDKTAA